MARTTSGRVSLRISLQPSRPAKSSSTRSAACNIVPIAPSATTIRSARALQKTSSRRCAAARVLLATSWSPTVVVAGWRSVTVALAAVRLSDDRTRPGSRSGDTHAPPRRAGDDRGVRGLERRRGGRQHRAGAPGADLGRRAAGRDRPRGLLRLPGHAPARAPRRRRHPPHRVADHPAVLWRCCRAPSGTSCSCNGIEPNLRWRAFCRELLDHVERLGVTKVITLGALLTDTPHTRPTPVSGTSYDAAVGRLDAAWSRPPTRARPASSACFQNACVEAGIPAFSFWASVPHYVSQARVPKAAVALLHRVEEVLDVEVPLGALPEQAEEWERTVSRDGRGRRRGARVRPAAGGAGRGVRRRPRGRRRHDRRRLRALPAPPRRRAGRAAERRHLTGRAPVAGGLYAGAFLGPFGGGVTVAMLPELGASYGVTAATPRCRSRPTCCRSRRCRWCRARSASGGAGGGRCVVAYVAYTAASLLCALAPTLAVFLGGRALQGVANAFTTPLLFAALASTVPPERLGRALGWFGSLQAAGQTSAPLVGGLAAECDWRGRSRCRAGGRGAGGRRHPGQPRRAPSGRPACARRGGATCCASALVAAVGWGCVAGLSFLVALRLEDAFGLSAGARGLRAHRVGRGGARDRPPRRAGVGPHRAAAQRAARRGRRGRRCWSGSAWRRRSGWWRRRGRSAGSPRSSCSSGSTCWCCARRR